ncbi:MAG: hypothetical protein ABH837_01575 [bacterium]
MKPKFQLKLFNFHNKKTIIVLLSIFIIILLGCGIYFFSNKFFINTSKDEKNQEFSNLYFGVGNRSSGEYQLVNVDNGKKESFIPTGYEFISSNSGNYRSSFRSAFPDYLILERDNQLFSYFVQEKKIEKIDIYIEESYEVNLFSSISEKNEFYIVVNEVLKDEDKWWDFEVINAKKYFFDAKTNQVELTDKINFGKTTETHNCYRYDSQYSRFFTWSCTFKNTYGSLKVYNIKTDTYQEIVNSDDFEIYDDYIKYSYNNGYFFAMSVENNYSKMIIIEPNKDTQKKEYLIDKSIQDFIQNEIYGYGFDWARMLYLKEKQTIIVACQEVTGGEQYGILLLGLNNEKIKDYKYIKTDFIGEDLKTRFTFGEFFTDEEKIYFLAYDYFKKEPEDQKVMIKIIDPETKKIEKSVTLDKGEVAIQTFAVSLFIIN